jgi:NhaP-type Na+/H+ or K+/H+ antiporter
MAMSLAIIIILGLVSNKLFEKLRLPGLLGMLILGVLLGPYVTNIISADILRISPDLRKIALIIILLRAGLGIKKDTLNKVGVSALKMSCIPGIFEGLTIMFVASYILGITKIEAGMLGFIIAAVSPAVVVPTMLNFMSIGKGEKKGIATIILAGASIDNVIAITMFSTFLGLYGGKSVNIAKKVFDIPVSIFMGIAIGGVVGIVLTIIFRKYHMRDTKKTLVLIASAIILNGLEGLFKNIVPIASLLGVMTVGFIILERYSKVANKISIKLSKVWVIAEILLFVLVGAQVNIHVTVTSGVLGLIIISLGLVARSIGVLVSLVGTNLNAKERLFCVISYIPKASVQAAMGAVPLAAGVKSGEVILAIAVLSIIVTAPLGAIGIIIGGERLLPDD